MSAQRRAVASSTRMPVFEQEPDQAFVPRAAEAFHGADQGALLLAVEPAGRGLDLAERLGGDDLLGQAGVGRPGEEGPQGGQLAVDGAGLELAVVAEVGLPLPQLGGGQGPQVGALLVGGLVPGGEGEQVLAVVLLGVVGLLVLDQVGGEPGQGVGPGQRGGWRSAWSSFGA